MIVSPLQCATGKLDLASTTPPTVEIKFSPACLWLAKPWSGRAHRKIVRSLPRSASQLVLVNPDGPPVSGSRVLCGQKLVSTGGLMELDARALRANPELKRCAHCERIWLSAHPNQSRSP